MRNLELSTPKFAVFDLDNTLYEYSPCHDFAFERLAESFASKFGCSKKEFSYHFYAARERIKSRIPNTASSHSRIIYISEMLRGMKVIASPSDLLILEKIYWRNYFTKMILISGAKDLIHSLRASGTKMVLITDLTEAIQLQKLLVLGLESVFDLIITSEVAGGDKITQQPFLVAHELLNDMWDEGSWWFGDVIHDFPQKDVPMNSFFFLRSLNRIKRADTFTFQKFDEIIDLILP